MKATVLIDNINSKGMVSEWGLSIYIENQGKNLLLDTGSSHKFLKNAKNLNLDIADVDYGILSHAHYDHANGLEAFFEQNKKASFYLRDGSKENCYGRVLFFRKYVGIHKGWLQTFQDRIEYAKGDYELMPGVTLIPHKIPVNPYIAKKSGMYVKENGIMIQDCFAHEQSLVIETEEGLVIFNSCSHSGAANIIKEVQMTYPEKKICALVGGFHLFSLPEKDVRALAAQIKETGIERIYTGHCTGKKAFRILHEELGDMVQQLHTGMVMEWK